jgi:peptide/nickel transport system substrate-binding protein
MHALTIALEKVDFPPPDRVTDNTSILTLKNLVFEPLLGWEAGQATPALFSHWTHSDDGRRWEFFIRPGAAFHDGGSCTPSDILTVIDGLVRSVDTFGMTWSYARYLAQATISAGAGLSIVVTNPEPFADILDIFTEFYISRSAADGRATLGTGPYRVIDFTPEGHAAL